MARSVLMHNVEQRLRLTESIRCRPDMPRRTGSRMPIPRRGPPLRRESVSRQYTFLLGVPQLILEVTHDVRYFAQGCVPSIPVRSFRIQ